MVNSGMMIVKKKIDINHKLIISIICIAIGISDWSLLVEYMELSEINAKADDVRKAFELLVISKALIGKPRARQWQFLAACLNHLLNPALATEFANLSAVQAAQLKFEIADRLQRFYLRPGKPVNFIFSLVHKANLAAYGVNTDEYPALSGYSLLIRDLSIEKNIQIPGNPNDLKPYLERVIAESMDAEFAAYSALPEIKVEELSRWFIAESPAMREIITVLLGNSKKGWIISNPFNPSTKRLLGIKVKKIGGNEAFVNTVEYWYLRWWDKNDNSYVYPYRETNRQTYILRRDAAGWKIYENLRPLPKISLPQRWKKRDSRDSKSSY